MKRIFSAFAVLAVVLTAAPAASAQGLLKKLSDAAKNVVPSNTPSSSSSAASAKPELSKSAANFDNLNVDAYIKAAKNIYYVSVSTGSARADGKTPQTAVKDLQKAIDLAEDGDVILVAEGNYLGNMDRGYIENGAFGSGSDNGKFISIIGGYDTGFTEVDHIKHITMIQPYSSASAIKNCLLNFTARHPYGYNGPTYNMLISGLTFEMGEINLYAAPNVEDERTGTPNTGVLSGLQLTPGTSPMFPTIGIYANDNYELHINVEDYLTVMNCTFINGSMFGLQGQMNKGRVEVCNNVFVACRYGACQIEGSVNDNDIDKCSLEFHHNTVLFPWPRVKGIEGMGQGFRFRNRIRTIDVHNNIFGCAVTCAVERVTYESNASLEKLKVSNLYDNLFFANHWDLEIANGASKGIGVPAARIEEAEEIGPKYENNREMPENEDFINAIDQPYLEGYMSLEIIQSSSYNPNSAANQFNRAFGLNQQGTEIVRPSMYANKYPWEKAFDLYGVVPDYGAQ